MMPQLNESFVGEGPGSFRSQSIVIARGVELNRNTDSEYKILDNISAELGNNTNAVGSIRIVSERPPCASCSDVANQFMVRYPNIKVTIDHVGRVVSPIAKPSPKPTRRFGAKR